MITATHTPSRRALGVLLLATLTAFGCSTSDTGNADSAEWSNSSGGGADAGSADAGTSFGTTNPPTGGEDTTAGGWDTSPGSTSADAGSSGAADTANSSNADWGGPSDSQEPVANTNVSLSGASDIGYFRALLEAGIVPQPEDITAEGFFAEHHTPLPAPTCGERICLQAMLGVMGNLLTGQNCTLLQVGLNSPIVADPGQRPPLTLSVVVDISGSMSSNDKIGFVRDGLHLLVDALHDEDQLAIVAYSDIVTVPFEMQAIADNRSDLRDVINALEADGGTNLYGGLEAGFEAVLEEYDSGRQHRVILLSDGQPTAGVTDEDQIRDMSRAFNSDGVGLTTIGLGTSFNHELMRGLAQQGDGNFYFLEDAGAVDEVFTEEVSYFTVPVAFDLTLDLFESEHYEVRRVLGSSLWEDTTEGGHLDVPSVFLAHREAHDDVTEEGGRRGGGSALMLELMPLVDEDDGSELEKVEVATLHLSFREPGTDRIVTDSVTIEYARAPWVVEETGLFQAEDVGILQKSFVMLNIFVTLESACQMFHLGAPEEALGTLRRVIAAVEDYNDELEDVDMVFNIELMHQLEDVILDNGGREPEFVEIPEDPWPAD